MRIPIKWLGEYVDLKGLSDEEVSLALTMTGTENEILKSEGNFEKIVVGEIKEIKDHSNADRLHVTKTDVGEQNGGLLQIVCGAPNIEVGQKVPVALVGAMIGEFEIKETDLRGVKSQGMLCSEAELGISDEHAGIMILSADSKVGENLSDALGHGMVVLDAEITPNRADCFSMIGVAREAAAALSRKMKNPNFEKAPVKTKAKIKVEVAEKELCPRYIAKVIENVNICESPKWMQERLATAGVRPINNVVDVTNYVMLEWGQPMHAFDGKKVSEKLVVRKAKSGETLETLDGTTRKLTRDDLVIADAKKAIALAGVMGGANSEVTGTSKNIILEAAVFDGVNVRKTSQRLGLRTEASNRFEKGVPLTLSEIAVERAASLIVEISKEKKEKSGKKAGLPAVTLVKVGENSDVLSKWIWVQHVGVRISEIEKFLGVKIGEENAVGILKSLGFEAEKFDFKKEARKHVGKPYVFGASFKTHGDMAFDCSYLTDYIYSRIGKFIGYTSLAQYKIGRPVKDGDLQPGDVLFVNGVIDKSVTDRYYVPDGRGGYKKIMLEKAERVGHNAIYIGNGRIIEAKHYQYDFKNKKWTKGSKAEVTEENLENFTKNPEYIGARRFIEDPEDFLAVTVPWWRLDVKIEEDVLEEIGRIYGYENFPSVLPGGTLPVFEENPRVKFTEELKNVLVGAGFNEVYNYSFVSGKALESVGEKVSGSLRIANPITPEQEYMRTTLVPSLLFDAKVNQDNFDDISLFEISAVYLPTGKNIPARYEVLSRQNGGGLPEEEPRLGVLTRVSAKDRAKAFFLLKGILELLAERLKIGKLTLKKSSVPYFKKGQSAEVFYKGKPIGKIGMVAEQVLESFGIKSELAVAEISLSPLLGQKMTVEYRSISRFPGARRDINFIFPSKLSAEDIERVITTVKDPLVKSTEIIDIYEGKGLAEGEKSITIRLVLGSFERTLTVAEIEEAQKRIIAALEKAGGKLRA